MEKRKFDFTIGIFDAISEKIKDKILNDSKLSETYGVGVYTDKYVIEELKTYPTKNQNERLDEVRKLKKVDFVFLVDTTEKKELKELVTKTYLDFINAK